jgi:hypothetical protein
LPLLMIVTTFVIGKKLVESQSHSYFVSRRFWVFSIVESTTFKMRKL